MTELADTPVRARNTLVIEKEIHEPHLDVVFEVLGLPEGKPLDQAPIDDGHVKIIRANSGNFVKLAPFEDLITRFRIVTVEEWRSILAAGWRLVKVGFDSGPDDIEAWWSGQRWNGWISPCMTQEQFRAMVPKWKEDPDYKLITHEDGSVSPPEGWCCFDFEEDEDGYASYYFIDGQCGARRVDGVWYEDTETWCPEKRAMVLQPKEKWRKTEPLDLLPVKVGDQELLLMDVSCGLMWVLEYDPADPPDEEDDENVD